MRSSRTIALALALTGPGPAAGAVLSVENRSPAVADLTGVEITNGQDDFGDAATVVVTVRLRALAPADLLVTVDAQQTIALVQQVVNDSDLPWTAVRDELLRDSAGGPRSSDGVDGLSFQELNAERMLTASAFSTVRVAEEGLRDALIFAGGTVDVAGGDEQHLPIAVDQFPIPDGGGAAFILRVVPVQCSLAMLVDADRDGLCDFPPGKTVVRGPMVVHPATPIGFSGTTLVEMDHLLVQPGALLEARADTLRRLELRALGGAIESDGTLDLDAGDDLLLTARRGAVALRGTSQLAAADLLRVRGDAGIAIDAGSALDGANKIELSAQGPGGGIMVRGARLGGRQIAVTSRLATSVPTGAKAVTLTNGATLVSEPSGTASAGNVTVRATLGTDPSGTPAIGVGNGAAIVSARNVVLATQRAGESVCLGANVSLEAAGGTGFVDVAGVRGDTIAADGVTLFGVVRPADGVDAGSCP